MSFGYKNFVNGVQVVGKSSTTSNLLGDIEVLTSNNKAHFFNGTSNSPLVTEDHMATLDNKIYISQAANPSLTGAVRLGNTESVGWRNAANTLDLLLTVTAGDQLQFNGNTIITATGALVANRAVITDGSAALTSSAVTSTELSRLSGILSSAVGITDTQTISNKTFTTNSFTSANFFTDNGTTFQDNTDTSKRFQFEVSSVTTGTTRTLTIPNANTTLVGTDFSQTLTNKDVRKATVSKTGTYTLVNTDDVILASASGGAFTLTLPAAGSVTGKIYEIVKTDLSNNAVTIDADGSETIGGSLTRDLDFELESLTIISDGSNWQILDWYIPTRQYSLTVTGTGFTTERAVGVVYKTVDNVWRLRFNIEGTRTAATTWALSVSGFVFKTTGATVNRQAVYANDNSGGSASSNHYVMGATSTLTLTFSGASTQANCFGDVELENKPTISL